MKTKKKTIAIMLITTLLVTLIGCDKSDNNENAITQLSDVKEEYVSEGEIAPITIMGNSETNFKDQIIREIVVARNMTEEEHQNYGNYRSNNFDKIEEFYFPNLEIDGFELFRIDMGYGGFSYSYAPKDVERDEAGYFSLYDYGIQIIINWEKRYNLSDIIKENSEMELTEDGFAYEQGDNSIFAQTGNMFFRVDVPPHMSKYEILRDLAYDVINSAELVIVDGYKLPETKEPPVTDKPEIVTTAEWKEVSTDVATDMVEWEYEFSTTAIVED